MRLKTKVIKAVNVYDLMEQVTNFCFYKTIESVSYIEDKFEAVILYRDAYYKQP